MPPSDELETLEKIGRTKAESLNRFLDRVSTVSVGALAFSVTFRNSIVGNGAEHVWILETAWICLTLSAVASVFLNLAGASAAIRLAERIAKDKSAVASSAHPVFDFLQLIVLVTFPFGLITFCSFAVLNTN